MNQTIQLGISTCPNDTFAFHAILNQRIETPGIDYQIELLDVEQLNQGLVRGKFDVAKASFHAAILLEEQMQVLPAGSALGFGVGPVLLSNQSLQPDQLFQKKGPVSVLCPGEFTTAHLLYDIFYDTGDIQHVVFSEIMPRLCSGEADFGVCIHEGRFAYQYEGLQLIADLGEMWERETACPLPLGGILARRSLGRETLKRLTEHIRHSIQYGLDHREETIPTMRQYAQEFDDRVLLAHVDLYVNEWTLDLGDQGWSALLTLREKYMDTQGGEAW